MCGIVGAIAQRNVVPILLEGLRRLEYRGYDSAGLAIVNEQGIYRQRAVGKVKELASLIEQTPVTGLLGIAHTRWATHGKPSENNAHPHVCRERVAVVHNGIIENHEQLRAELTAAGYRFNSETDTEVVVNLIFDHLQSGLDLLPAVQHTLSRLEGAYALAVVDAKAPDRLVVCRKGSPLVIGVGIEEYFIASDVAALLPVTQRFIFLEEGDVAQLSLAGVSVFDSRGQLVVRPIKESLLKADAVEKGAYKHYMLKEIHEQPWAVSETLEGRFIDQRLNEAAFSHNAGEVFDAVRRVLILACGTSYHAGLVARYWFEKLAGVPCQVEVASEYRYRRPVLEPGTLVVTISQSGETADTLAALEEAKALGASHALTICNVPESSLVRASDLVLMTRAGPEIGVASTKAFVTQLTALLMLVIAIGRRHKLTEELETRISQALFTLPGKIDDVLKLDKTLETLAERFVEKQHALFLGRGTHYPIALEGALKLKEISYIHAEGYPAGELKHGPLALIDADMPVITVAPNNSLLEKLKSNIQEVSARNGQLIVFMDETLAGKDDVNVQIVNMPAVDNIIAPMVYIVPLQLLAYHVALLKGTDVDQPRNLAKSVTVE
ncbi:MAG: glutamine--fructose-6-phosphate transaminase (isomerizing) [Methylococcales bacterium]|nr:glutamine--fructose-6-phosphate transaminase (isomerizing) [Methylococcales bacterium]